MNSACGVVPGCIFLTYMRSEKSENECRTVLVVWKNLSLFHASGKRRR